MQNGRRLCKSQTDKKIFGVCGGLGEYFNINSLWIRLAFCIAVICFGTGVLLYILLAILMPKY